MQDIGTTLQQILLWIKQTKLQYVFTDQMFPNMFTLFVSSFPYSILLLFHIQISTPDICHCINFFNIPRHHLPVEVFYLYVLAGIKITILLPMLWILPLFKQEIKT